MVGLWVLLRTKPRRELVAARSVAAHGVEAYVPRPPARDLERRPLVFPGYLFARPLPGTDDLLRIRSVPGSTYALPRGGPAARLPERVIHLLRRRQVEPPRPLPGSERVVVLAEPFSSLEAIFDRQLSAAGCAYCSPGSAGRRQRACEHAPGSHRDSPAQPEGRALVWARHHGPELQTLEPVMNFRHLAHLEHGPRTADLGPISGSGPGLLRLAAARKVHNRL
jgi:hypothetical protein